MSVIPCPLALNTNAIYLDFLRILKTVKIKQIMTNLKLRKLYRVPRSRFQIEGGNNHGALRETKVAEPSWYFVPKPTRLNDFP